MKRWRWRYQRGGDLAIPVRYILPVQIVGRILPASISRHASVAADSCQSGWPMDRFGAGDVIGASGGPEMALPMIAIAAAISVALVAYRG